MEFGEKLQALRKSRGLTQEELAEALFVSRTAVSKWESGRGYPSIDSLKELSGFFSVSIDDLLSGDKLISIAQKEHAANLRDLCHLLFGMTDLFSLMLILLPLYPQTANGFVYGVSLLRYTGGAPWSRALYWAGFLTLVGLGAANVLLTQLKRTRCRQALTACSMGLGIGLVFLLALAREPYAVAVAFFLLIVKAALLFRQRKADC